MEDKPNRKKYTEEEVKQRKKEAKQRYLIKNREQCLLNNSKNNKRYYLKKATLNLEKKIELMEKDLLEAKEQLRKNREELGIVVSNHVNTMEIKSILKSSEETPIINKKVVYMEERPRSSKMVKPKPFSSTILIRLFKYLKYSMNKNVNKIKYLRDIFSDMIYIYDANNWIILPEVVKLHELLDERYEMIDLDGVNDSKIEELIEYIVSKYNPGITKDNHLIYIK